LFPTGVRTVRLRKSGMGIVELPFKLLISIIIVAATASAGLGALSMFSRNMLDQSLGQQARMICSAAERLDEMGFGSSVEVRLEIDNAPMDHVEYFRIGYPLSAPVHPYSAMVRYKGSGSSEGHATARDAADNFLPMCSARGGTLALGAGEHALLLTKLYSDLFGTVFIEVSGAD